MPLPGLEFQSGARLLRPAEANLKLFNARAMLDMGVMMRKLVGIPTVFTIKNPGYSSTWEFCVVHTLGSLSKKAMGRWPGPWPIVAVAETARAQRPSSHWQAPVQVDRDRLTRRAGTVGHWHPPGRAGPVPVTVTIMALPAYGASRLPA